MLKKVLFLGAIIVIVVFLSGCTDNSIQISNESTNLTNITTKTYSNADAGVTFNYPENWTLFNITGKNGIVGIGDPNSVDKNNNTNTIVIIQKTALPTGQTLESTYDATYKDTTQDPSYQLVSKRNLTIDGQTAIENIHKINVNGVQKVEKDVWIEKNGTIYVIICSALTNDFNRQQSYFNVIINSFKIQ